MKIYLSLRNPEVPDPQDVDTSVDGGRDAYVFAVFHANVEAVCVECGRAHDKLWIIKRALADTFGHFPVVRINGEKHVPDMSIPFTVDRLPRDAREISPEESARVWHEDNESHVFGGPNVAKALRETIAAANAR